MTQRGWTVDEILASLPIDPEPYTVLLLRAVESEKTRIDDIIRARSRWKIERMPVLDLVVTRLALAELLQTDTPTGVVLAEAVDLAGRYSTDESARYVHGLLSAASKDIRTK